MGNQTLVEVLTCKKLKRYLKLLCLFKILGLWYTLSLMSRPGPVYFDHNATTPVSEGILSRLPEWAAAWGNPSSIHALGRDPKQILRETRQSLARQVNCSPLEIVFTSGGSESNNSVLKATWQKFKNQRNHFVVSAVEHPSVMKTAEWLRSQGALVDVIPVHRSGQIDLDSYKSVLSENTALVSVMAANNETGSLFPIAQMVELARNVGALFHTDAVQMLGKSQIDLKAWGVDYASFSAHKVSALKGSGALYIRKNAPFESLILGGGQERHRRGGTENVLGIAAFGAALSELGMLPQRLNHLELLRNRFESRVLEEIPLASVTAGEFPRLPNTSSLVLPGVDGETLLMSLDLKGYAVSTGAACSSGNPEPSPVLLAMGLSRQEAQNSLRVSFGPENTLEQVNEFVDVLKAVVSHLRQISASENEVHHA